MRYDVLATLIVYVETSFIICLVVKTALKHDTYVDEFEFILQKSNLHVVSSHNHLIITG